MSDTEWLTRQIDIVKQKFEDAESNAMAYQYAAEAETYARIKNNMVLFGGPENALQVYKQHGSTGDFGMTAGRIRALKRYLEQRCDA